MLAGCLLTFIAIGGLCDMCALAAVSASSCTHNASLSLSRPRIDWGTVANSSRCTRNHASESLLGSSVSGAFWMRPLPYVGQKRHDVEVADVGAKRRTLGASGRVKKTQVRRYDTNMSVFEPPSLGVVPWQRLH